MDGPLILEFQTRETAEHCLDAINAITADYWAGEGYTIVMAEGTKQLVGKNAATGIDEPANAMTLTWDVVQESPEGTYYFSSLSGSQRFAPYMNRLTSFDFVERNMPPQWRDDSLQD